MPIQTLLSRVTGEALILPCPTATVPQVPPRPAW